MMFLLTLHGTYSKGPKAFDVNPTKTEFKDRLEYLEASRMERESIDRRVLVCLSFQGLHNTMSQTSILHITCLK